MKTLVVSLSRNTEIEVQEDTQFVMHIPNLNADMSYQLNLIFNKPFITSEILGIFRVAKGKTLNLTTITNHVAQHTSCMTKVKYVLESKAKANYLGKILIQKSAYQTSSFLHTDALVVGEETSNISEPILQIEANDVKASHGSTTGRINPDHLYYLMSRALDYETAQNLIVQGFFDSLISEIADVKIQNQVKRSLRFNGCFALSKNNNEYDKY